MVVPWITAMVVWLVIMRKNHEPLHSVKVGDEGSFLVLLTQNLGESYEQILFFFLTVDKDTYIHTRILLF